MVRTPNGAGELKCHDVNARNLVLRINQKQYAFPEGTQRESAQRQRRYFLQVARWRDGSRRRLILTPAERFWNLDLEPEL